jgi:LuxR family transcriptional regulator, regulator of acetate metabolism
MTRAAHPLSGPVEAELARRLDVATAEARRLLGDRGGSGGPGGNGGQRDELRLPELIAALSQRVGGIEAADHQVTLERLRHRFEARFDALGRAHAAVTGLRAITAPAAILDRAPAALCAASNFSRALLSLVGGGQMVAQSAHVAADRGGADRVVTALREQPVQLSHPLIETELLRRRRATIVVDAPAHPRTDHRLAELMGWSDYAAAPLVVGAKVVGVLHAAPDSQQRLDVLDRDTLWEFTSELAQAYESASLRRALRQEREQMRRFLDWLGARSGGLTEAPIRLSTVQRPPAPARSDSEPVPGSTARDDRTVFEGLLTRRELDVLRLLADGHTNKSIAQELVISDGTVKFHVNSILRKLHVANRAEAVARYLRLLGMRSP